MCGIVGIISDAPAIRPCVEALKRLEYRGYDSFGLAYLDEDRICTRKDVGSVSENDSKGFFNGLPDAARAIAHTRWATHGGVTAANAHPHLSNDGKFAVVHNGVIENHVELKAELVKQGFCFRSETDTEVVAHLLQSLYSPDRGVFDAVARMVGRIQGEYALVILTTLDPDTLYCVKHKSPLAYTVADGTLVVASDQRALAPFNRDVVFLEDGDLLVFCADKGKSRCLSLAAGAGLTPVERKAIRIDWREDELGKAGFPHYMLKEINEIPVAVKSAMAIREEVIEAIVEECLGRRTIMTGAGSAYYVSMIGQYYFADLAKKYVITHPSDELSNLCAFEAGDHLLAISQSGETFDTLESVRQALSVGAKVSSVNNVYGSTMQRLATIPVFQGAGTEICVLSTKSIVSQAVILLRIAARLGLRTGKLDAAAHGEVMKALDEFPAVASALIEDSSHHISSMAMEHASIDNWFFIGRGVYYPVAMESALKFKEVSYHHAEGMPAGFFKHGTISLIDDGFYTMVFLPDRKLEGELFSLTASNVSEIRARNGRVVGIGHEAAEGIKALGLHGYVQIPRTNRHTGPLLHLIVGELMAYYCARSLGRSIDKPRALAKSVTVR